MTNHNIKNEWNKGYRSYSKEHLINICKEYFNYYKKVPTLKEITAYSSIKVDHFIDAFGKWSSLLIKAGLDPSQYHYLKQWSRKHVSCIICKTQKIKHFGKGLCINCYISYAAKRIKNDSLLLNKQRMLQRGYAAKRRLHTKLQKIIENNKSLDDSKKCLFCDITLVRRDNPKFDYQKTCGKQKCKNKLTSYHYHTTKTLKGYNSPNKEHRQKLHDLRIGKQLSEDTKNKISRALKGKPKRKSLSKKNLSQEHKEKIRMKLLDRTLPLETKKKMSASHQGISLKQWTKFTSFEPYTSDFNERFKEAIRARDGYCCKLCNIFKIDHIKLYNKNLPIHHIDYDKTLTIKQNCITLCSRCNSLVNKDREIWTKHFQEMLKKDYGYQYTEEQKIIMDYTTSG